MPHAGACLHPGRYILQLNEGQDGVFHPGDGAILIHKPAGVELVAVACLVPAWGARGEWDLRAVEVMLQQE